MNIVFTVQCTNVDDRGKLANEVQRNVLGEEEGHRGRAGPEGEGTEVEGTGRT